jgi:multidrug efflux pump subunit AcrB
MRLDVIGIIGIILLIGIVKRNGIMLVGFNGLLKRYGRGGHDGVAAATQ